MNPSEEEKQLALKHEEISNTPHEKIDHLNIKYSKPWGHEQMIFISEQTSVWLLNIYNSKKTSLHCHFKKDTKLICIAGSVKIGLYNASPVILNVMDELYLPRYKFHSLEALTDNTWVIEIEIFKDGVNFSDKNDLLRISDVYNREKTGYEKSVSGNRNVITFPITVGYTTINIGENWTSHSKNVLLKGIIERSPCLFQGPGSTIYKDEPGTFICLYNSFPEERKIIRNIEQLKYVLSDNTVLTSGCFDILHKGHISNLKKASTFGKNLIVCLSSDEQIKRLKGENRPVNSQEDRAMLLAYLNFVDYVVLYDEDDDGRETTLNKIMEIVKPAVWVKGSEYNEFEIRNKHPILRRIELIPMIQDISTTKIITRIQDSDKLFKTI